MFTGIIKYYVPISDIITKPGLTTFALLVPEEVTDGLKPGASVANDGVCLTVTKIEGNKIWFDAMEETLRLTTIGQKEVGGYVNLERSATFADEIGGHIVSGHVTGMAEITEITKDENNTVMTFHVPGEMMKYIFSKGFIALDGASLTVVDAHKEEANFKVWFIPETLARTGFGTKQVGDYVNVEIDRHTQAIVETVEAYLDAQS